MKFRLIACLAMSLSLLISLPFGVKASEEWEQVGQTFEDTAEVGGIYRSNDIDAAGDTIAIYYSGGNGAPSQTRVFDLDGNNWVQRGRTLVSPETGGATAEGLALSGNGKIVAMTSGPERGDRIRVFEWSDSLQDWTQLGRTLKEGASSRDYFGESIDLDFSGKTLSATRRGASYSRGGNAVYEYDESTNDWIQKGQTLQARNTGEDLQFIRLSDDGDNLLSGNCRYNRVRGAAQLTILRWNGVTNLWDQRGSDFVQSGYKGGCYGTLSEDGNILLIQYEGDDSVGTDAGVIKLFYWQPATGDWQPLGNPIYGEKANEKISGTLSADGKTVSVNVWGQPGYIRSYRWDESSGGWLKDPSEIEITYEIERCCWNSINRAGDVLINTSGTYAPPRPVISQVFSFGTRDFDSDGIDDDLDNCPETPNPDQTDTDSDGAGDACDDDDDGDWVLDVDDNCPLTPNQDQADTDGSGLGDACNDFIDEDNDEYEEEFDNCPVDFNPDQADFDGDGVGDACDPDVDGDLVNNEYDSCPNTPLGAEVEGTGCSIDQLCPCDSARNHGQYQSCMVQAVNSFIEVGLLAKQDKGRILSESARSSCGK